MSEFEGIDVPMEERIIEVPPTGRFDAEVTKAEATKSNDGRAGIRLTFRFTSGEMEGRILSSTIWMPNREMDEGGDWGKPESPHYREGQKYPMMASRAMEDMASAGFAIQEYGGLNKESIEAFIDSVVGTHLNVNVKPRYVNFAGDDVPKSEALLEDGSPNPDVLNEVRQEVDRYRPL